MSSIAVPPYVLTDDDGGNPRVAFAITTPAAFVLVESRARGAYSTHCRDGSGVGSALATVREYARTHAATMDRLYKQLARHSTRDS